MVAGFVMGMTSAGALVGAHYACGLRSRLGATALMRWCLIGTGIATAGTAGILLAGINMTGWAIGIYWMLTGAFYAVMLTCLGLTIQTHAPTERIGAVSAKIQNTRVIALIRSTGGRRCGLLHGRGSRVRLRRGVCGDQQYCASTMGCPNGCGVDRQPSE